MNWKTITAIAGLAAVLIGGYLITQQGDSENQDKLTIVSFGGAYQAAQRDAYMQPFSEATGTQIVETEYNGDYGLLRERASAPAGVWDVVSVESGPALRGQNEGIFLTVPESVTEGLTLVDGTKRDASVGHLIFSTILAFRDDASVAQPNDWGDFWDLEQFPGKRGLRNNPRGTLEIALIADGVSREALYPLDVERALSKLEDIRDQAVFWDSGAQPIQLLANNSVTMTTIYNGRAWAAKNDENLPIGWSLDGGLLEFEYWAVPANAPNPKTAFEFIRFSLEQEQQASFANQIAYVPTNSSAMSLVAPDIRSALPDTKVGNQITVDAVWWAENEATVSARWQEWMAGQ